MTIQVFLLLFGRQLQCKCVATKVYKGFEFASLERCQLILKKDISIEKKKETDCC